MSSLEKSLESKASLPKGYTFVAKGNVYVTRHCREKTRQAGQVLYIIHDQKTNRRIGLACPSPILREVQANEKATAVHRRQQVFAKDKHYISNARSILLRLFPRIPPESAEQVLSHGYLKGSGRVGRSSKMSDSRKMTLAVTAHARHKHTPYDALLRQKGPGQAARFEARNQIRSRLFEVLREWGMVGQLPSLEPDTELETSNDSSQDSSHDSDNILERSCVDIVDTGTPERRNDKSCKEASPVVLVSSKRWKGMSPAVSQKSETPRKTDGKALRNSIRAPKNARRPPKPKGILKLSKNRVQKTMKKRELQPGNDQRGVPVPKHEQLR